jgi:hypothetical protein
VEGGEIEAEEIGRTAKIKHTKQNREKPKQKKGEQTKTKYVGKQSKNRKIKHQTINQRGSDKI